MTLISSALKFNAVADWWDEYTAYVIAHNILVFAHTCPSYVLKHHIYQFEMEHHRLSCTRIDLKANERTALVEQPNFSSIDNVFVALLNQEFHKITVFYERKEKELFYDLQTLKDLVAGQDEAGAAGWENHMDDYADEDDE